MYVNPHSRCPFVGLFAFVRTVHAARRHLVLRCAFDAQ
jgi:hypothetical protein